MENNTSSKTLLDQLIEKAGSQTAVAEFLGISCQAVQQWKKIPLRRAKSLSAKFELPIDAFFDQDGAA